jgi:hypothetical protein
MAVIGYPQRVATALTALSERGQRFLVRRLGTRSSASHFLAPASKGQLYHPSLRLLSTQDCHSAVFLASPLGQRDKAQDTNKVGRRGQTNYVDRTIERIIAKRQNPPMKR